MKFRVQLREMAADEIAGMIPADTLARIRMSDPNPVFRAFVVGHEGEARGNMVGIGNIVKRWYKDAVEKLHERISAGLQLFSGHAETNSQEGRTAIGQVVGKRLMRIGDRLSAVVACYINPSFRHLPFDVASIEAEVTMDRDGRGLKIAEVDKVTGIALGNSRVNVPGFAGATLLGELQAFAKTNGQGDNLMDLTLEDVRTFLSQEKVKPSDLFGPEALAADPSVRGIAEDKVRERIAGEFARRKEAEEKLAKIESTQAEKEAVLRKENADLKLATAKSKVGQLFEAQRASRKLDERQIKFIQPRLERFNPSKPEAIEQELNAWLDAEVDEYGKIAKEVFGVEPEKQEPKPGAEPTDHKGGSGVPREKFLDPAQNPMIKLA